jgi:predicted NUDIX family NTP pyrophosphohydrolase
MSGRDTVATSAGILLYRRGERGIEVLLVHPGGPYWARRDEGAWSIPKGEIGEGESPLHAARREFREETGARVDGPFVALGVCRQKGGKQVHAFAVEGAFDPATRSSVMATIEWPPRSGRRVEFPEVDRAEWFTLPEARVKLIDAQRVFLDALERAIVE